MMLRPEAADFAIDEMPGDQLHAVLRALRARGPIQPTRFLGAPCHIITGHDALGAAFRDDETFPGHRTYQLVGPGVRRQTRGQTPRTTTSKAVTIVGIQTTNVQTNPKSTTLLRQHQRNSTKTTSTHRRKNNRRRTDNRTETD